MASTTLPRRATAPWADWNIAAIRPMHRAHDGIGEPRKGFAGLLRRHRAGQDARADQEHLLLAERADAVEEILVRFRLRQRHRQATPRALPVRAARRRNVESMSASITWGCAASVSASRGAVPSTLATRATRSGFCRSSENSRAPPCRLPRKRSKVTSAASGFSARAMWSIEERHELGEDRARRRSPQRPRRAGEPASHRLRHLDRLAESHRAQLVEGFGGIGLGREDEAAALGGARRRVLEQARIVALHRAEVAEQRRREGVAIGIAHEAGERRELLRRRGQRMGLLVGDHLQAMLDGAQER